MGLRGQNTNQRDRIIPRMLVRLRRNLAVNGIVSDSHSQPECRTQSVAEKIESNIWLFSC